MELEKYIESLTLTIRTSEEVRLKKDEVKGSIKKCCKNIFLVVLHRPPRLSGQPDTSFTEYI